MYHQFNQTNKPHLYIIVDNSLKQKTFVSLKDLKEKCFSLNFTETFVLNMPLQTQKRKTFQNN